MILRIQVMRLFGLYDYDIHFTETPAVNILTGPNGYGKTTLLRAVDHLYKGDFWYFHFLSFDNLKVTLSEQMIEIQRTSIELEANGDMERPDDTSEKTFEELVTLYDKSGNSIESVKITGDYIQGLLTSCRRRIPLREPSSLNDEELISRYYDSEDDNYFQQNCKNISLALQEYDTRYLPAQRVYNHVSTDLNSYRYRRGYFYEIDHVNEEISRLYRRTQNMFASTSQRIDATFISRLVKRKESYSQVELKAKLSGLEKRIDGYKELNLFNDMELLDYSLDDDASYENLKSALSLYVDDMNAKMDRFEELYQKISLYKRVVISKVLSEKTIDFSDGGLTITNANGYRLNDLHKLSSGEQNLLILYYNLIFRSNSKTILLIDEPENSLHVAWQSKMLDDYIDMAKTTGCQILMATHSPTFIDGRWELTTDLYRQYKEKDA